MKNITVHLSDIKAITDSLFVTKQDIEKRAHDLINSMVELGAADASERFSNALYAGTNDATVEGRMTGKTEGEVEATGESVLFIEYGTGIGPVEPPHHAGEYGQGQGADPPWYYYGEQGNMPDTMVVRNDSANGTVIRTFGNPANLCMHLAKQTVEEELERRLR